MEPDRPAGLLRRLPPFFFAYAAWVVALLSMLGSLFFSEVMKLPPCSLCWYQRIPMYALVLVVPVGIVLRDRNLAAYALPLALVGLGLAIYHNLLYYGVIAEELAPCTAGVPCNARQIEWLGFITIPLLGLISFAVIVTSLLAHRKTQQS
jgi:disulfide bond formation protein DsbB